MRVALLSDTLAELGGGEKHGLTMLAPLLGIHDVDILYDANRGAVTTRQIAERFDIDTTGIGLVPYEVPWAVPNLSRRYDLLINVTFGRLMRSRARKNLLMVYCPIPLHDRAENPLLRKVDHAVQRSQLRALELLDRIDPTVSWLGFGAYRERNGPLNAAGRLPLFLLRKLAWHRGLPYHLGQSALDGYDQVLAISEYSAGWTRRYYGRDARVLYPRIDTDRFAPAPAKGPIVLSVGRFQPEPDSKKHHVLLASFKRLHDEGTLAGWRMWICGGSNGTAPYERYVDRLREEAEGYPVSFGVNISFDELAEIYGRASLYWHAMGYGEEAERFPWRCEHFGMTTVEAMAAGCVPMVVAAGGQPEIVSDGRDGYTWHTPDGLEEQVRRFVGLPGAEVDRLRRAARARAQDFGASEFQRRLREIYGALGVPCRGPAPGSAPGSLVLENAT